MLYYIFLPVILFFKSQIMLWRLIIKNKLAQKVAIIFFIILLSIVFLAYILPEKKASPFGEITGVFFNSIKALGYFIALIFILPLAIFNKNLINLIPSSYLEIFSKNLDKFIFPALENAEKSPILGFLTAVLLLSLSVLSLWIKSFIILSLLWIILAFREKREKIIKKPNDKRKRKFKEEKGFWDITADFLMALGLISLIRREEEKQKRYRGY